MMAESEAFKHAGETTLCHECGCEEYEENLECGECGTELHPAKKDVETGVNA